MFGLNRRRAGQPILTVVSPEASVPAPPPETPHADLLRRWMSLAETQQKVIQALASEITRTSRYVETEGDALSERFQRLAVSAQQQTARVDSLTALAMGVEIDGESVPIDRVAAMLEAALADVVVKILMLSKDSMSMVYAMDTLSANVESVEKCNGRIDGINTTMNMLALNARIEAERAGAAGAAFRVVANEVRELSKSTQMLATTMNTELKTISDGLTSSHATLRRIATIDMTDNILVKERLEQLLKAMVERNGSLERIVADAVKESSVIAGDVEGMITGIQFQDRTKQRLEHVVDTLNVIGEAVEDLRSSTAHALPDIAASAAPDAEWVRTLLARYTMSEMRERFVAQILDGKSMEPANDTGLDDAPSSSGSMELF